MLTFYWHLLALTAAALLGGGLTTFTVWRACERSWRRGYADGHRTGVRHAWNAQNALADDVIQLVPHLDRDSPPPGA